MLMDPLNKITIRPQVSIPSFAARTLKKDDGSQLLDEPEHQANQQYQQHKHIVDQLEQSNQDENKSAALSSSIPYALPDPSSYSSFEAHCRMTDAFPSSSNTTIPIHQIEAITNQTINEPRVLTTVPINKKDEYLEQLMRQDLGQQRSSSADSEKRLIFHLQEYFQRCRKSRKQHLLVQFVHHCATQIQKLVRGYLCRYNYNRLLRFQRKLLALYKGAYEDTTHPELGYEEDIMLFKTFRIEKDNHSNLKIGRKYDLHLLLWIDKEQPKLRILKVKFSAAIQSMLESQAWIKKSQQSENLHLSVDKSCCSLIESEIKHCGLSPIQQSSIPPIYPWDEIPVGGHLKKEREQEWKEFPKHEEAGDGFPPVLQHHHRSRDFSEKKQIALQQKQQEQLGLLNKRMKYNPMLAILEKRITHVPLSREQHPIQLKAEIPSQDSLHINQSVQFIPIEETRTKQDELLQSQNDRSEFAKKKTIKNTGVHSRLSQSESQIAQKQIDLIQKETKRNLQEGSHLNKPTKVVESHVSKPFLRKRQSNQQPTSNNTEISSKIIRTTQPSKSRSFVDADTDKKSKEEKKISQKHVQEPILQSQSKVQPIQHEKPRGKSSIKPPFPASQRSKSNKIGATNLIKHSSQDKSTQTELISSLQPLISKSKLKINQSPVVFHTKQKELKTCPENIIESPLKEPYRPFESRIQSKSRSITSSITHSADTRKPIILS